MALTNAFYEAVQSGNVRRVRIMMQDSLLVDPTFSEFNAMEKVAAAMTGLYDKHDGKEFIEDQTLWSDEYMDSVMVKVLSNFSHERINHLKEVVRYLRPVTKTAPLKQEQTSCRTVSTRQHNSYKEEKRRCQEQGDYQGAKSVLVRLLVLRSEVWSQLLQEPLPLVWLAELLLVPQLAAVLLL